MPESSSSNVFGQCVMNRSQVLAARALQRTLAGKELSVQPCRGCGVSAPCRSYDFKVRRHLRFVESGGLGANTTWIMAKHQEMITGSGAVCAECMKAFLLAYFGKITRVLLAFGVALCAPVVVASFFLFRRSIHEMSEATFVAASFVAVLGLLGVACLMAAWFADRFLFHKVNRAILLNIAALEREPLRTRFPPATYALQIGLRFSDQGNPSASPEVISSDDALPAKR